MRNFTSLHKKKAKILRSKVMMFNATFNNISVIIYRASQWYW